MHNEHYFLRARNEREEEEKRRDKGNESRP